MDIMKVPTVHRNLGANKELSKIFWQAAAPNPHGSAIPVMVQNSSAIFHRTFNCNV